MNVRPTIAARPAPAPIIDIPIDESVVQTSAFSPKFIGVILGAAILGLGFGYFIKTSSYSRMQYTGQKEAAIRVRDGLRPKIEAAQNVAAQINKLDPTKPQPELAEQLAKADFVPAGGTLAGNASLLGGSNVYNVNQFMAQALVMQQLLKEHHRMTNTVDKEELQQLLENNELLQGNKQFAVAYDYRGLLSHLQSKAEDKQYAPRPGQLVILKPGAEVMEDGNIEVIRPSDNKTEQAAVKGLIPLNVTELVKTGGQNALQRYDQRVRNLKVFSRELEKSAHGLLDGINPLADRADAPLIQLSSSDAPSSSAPSGAPPAEVAPAEAAPADAAPADAAPADAPPSE